MARDDSAPATKGDIVLLKTDISELKTDMSDMRSDIAVLHTDVTELKTDVSALKTDVSVLKTDVSELKGDVSVLKTDVSELKGDVSVLKTDVSELKGDVSVLKTDVSELKGDVRHVKERLDQHDSQFELLITLIHEESKETKERFREMKEYMDEQFVEQRRHFDFVAETMLVDFRNALNDRTVQHGNQLNDHERRIGRLEKHVNLAA